MIQGVLAVEVMTDMPAAAGIEIVYPGFHFDVTGVVPAHLFFGLAEQLLAALLVYLFPASCPGESAGRDVVHETVVARVGGVVQRSDVHEMNPDLVASVPGHGPEGRVEVRLAPAQVGLEVVCLRPLVPRLDEDHPLVLGAVVDEVHGLFQVLLVQLRSGPVQDETVFTGAGGVVPVGHDAGVVIPAQCVVREGVRYEGFVRVHLGELRFLLAEEAQLQDLLFEFLVERLHVLPGDHRDRRVRGVGVEAAFDGTPREVDHGHEMEAAEPLFRGELAPRIHEKFRLLEVLRFIDAEDVLTVHLHVARVAECVQHRVEVVGVVLHAGVSLFDEDPVGAAVPDTGPGMVGPGKAEGKIRFARLHHFTERALKEPFAASEPVVPVAKALYPVFPRHVRLLFPSLGQAQVIEPEVCREVGLLVPYEQGLGLGGVGPLGESRSPPRVVLGDRVKLWEVKGDETGFLHCFL